MNLHNPFRRHTATRFIQVNTHLCEACWNCLEVCPKPVLGKLEIGPHRHIHIDDAENCNGCKRCVRACPHSAIEYIYKPKSRRQLQTG